MEKIVSFIRSIQLVLCHSSLVCFKWTNGRGIVIWGIPSNSCLIWLIIFQLQVCCMLLWFDLGICHILWILITPILGYFNFQFCIARGFCVSTVGVMHCCCCFFLSWNRYLVCWVATWSYMFAIPKYLFESWQWQLAFLSKEICSCAWKVMGPSST